MTGMTNYLEDLNEDQKRAVTFGGDKLLVLAGAGSGKTRVLTYRAAWLAEKLKIPASNILLLTFTNKAAGEMKERVETLCNTRPGFAGTFHSFCARLLRIEGEALEIDQDYVIYDTQDTLHAIKDIYDKFNINKDTLKESSVAYAIGNAKNQMITPPIFGEMANTEKQKLIFKVYAEYEKLLRESRALDFDDLLLKSVELFRKNQEILVKWQNKLTHILVDEWQDTNTVQYTLTKLLVGINGNLTAVGDASQSIYSWRGADFKNIQNLMRDYKELQVINLEQNYRSSQNILTAANSVIKRNSTHPVLKLWTQAGNGEKIKIARLGNTLEEANFVAQEINSLIDSGEHINNYSDVAVLYRTNAQSRLLEESLLHQGIPYTLIGGVKFYQRKEIKDVLSYLRILLNPKDTVAIKRAKTLGKRRFEAFEKLTEELKSRNSEGHPERAQQAEGSGNLYHNLTTLQILDEVLSATKYADKYKRETEENFQRLENLKELRSVASEFKSLQEFLENAALVESGNEKVFNADSAKGKVTLMTLHSAKGLEFPVVFIVGMEEGIFPHSRSLYDTHELEEERRLAYVGITRAKKLLYLCSADKRLYYGQKTTNPPSRFIQEIPDYLTEAVEPGHAYAGYY